MNKYDSIDEERFADFLEELKKYIGVFPTQFRETLEKELKEIISLLKDSRPPRFMLVGRRGAGKSTLINALFDKKIAEVGSVVACTAQPQWYDYEDNNKKMRVLDTRGFQEGGSSSQEVEENVYQVLKSECPDVILFLCRATDVDAAIQGDLQSLEKVAQYIDRIHSRKLPIVGILTKCDELDPPDVKKQLADDPEKIKNITAAINTIEKYLSSEKYPLLLDRLVKPIIPTSAYVRYRQDDSQDKERDYRYNIDLLAERLLEELPKDAKVSWARLAHLRKFQRVTAAKLVNTVALMCGLLSSQPLPGADIPIIPVIAGIQLVMVTAIGFISGRNMSLATARDFLASLGVGVVGQLGVEAISQSLLKLIPGLGSVIVAGKNCVSTKGLGDAAIVFFIEQGRVPTNKS